MVSKSIENPLKKSLSPPWDTFGVTLEPLGAHAVQKARFWRPLGGSWEPTWLQFHVLRTYRRAAGENRKAKVNGEAWALHF